MDFKKLSKCIAVIEELVYSGKKITTSSFVTKIKRKANFEPGAIKFSHKPLGELLAMIDAILMTKNPLGLLNGLRGLWVILLGRSVTSSVVWVCNATQGGPTWISKHLSSKEAATYCNKIIGKNEVSASKVSSHVRAKRDRGPNFIPYRYGYFSFHSKEQFPNTPERDGVCYMSPWVSNGERFELWTKWLHSK